MLKRVLILVAVVSALAACGARGGPKAEPPRGPAGETPVSGQVVNVTESEFRVTFDSTQVNAGVITFVVKNEGHIPHDLRISGQGVDQRTPMIMPKQSGNLTLELEPGTYMYECMVEGHAQAGMHGTLTVQGEVSEAASGPTTRRMSVG